MVGGAPLDGQPDDLPGHGLGLLLQPGLRLLDFGGRLVGHLGLQLADQHILGLLGGHAGDTLQLGHLPGLDALHFLLGRFQLGHLGLKGLFLLLDVVGLPVQILFLLLQPVLLLLDVAAALLLLLLPLVAGGENGLLGLYHGFPLLALGGLDGVVEDALGLLLGAAQLLFGHVFAVNTVSHHAEQQPGDGHDHT